MKIEDKTIKKYFNKYKNHISQFGNDGELYDIDDLSILKLSEWEKLYEDNRAICEQPIGDGGGYTQKTQSGYSQVRAEYTIMVKSQEMIMKLGACFGITPADRAKILGSKTAPKKKKKLAFD